LGLRWLRGYREEVEKVEGTKSREKNEVKNEVNQPTI
jgi:hypothetical protein